ncbi:14963_t:CDS:1 [Acaulospora morrowiae]|uniref:14963_t:CDS:1 n=1 Tax=Acaulospora morrowiae TaxID=94023 RepID=A0A9N9HLT0_9GLOM|nr:14963_t:CDS:1 [Acaulospora morrowiae]
MPKDTHGKRKNGEKNVIPRKGRNVHLFETPQFKEDLKRSIDKNFKKTYPQGMKIETSLPLDQLLAPCKKTRGKKGRITRPQNAFILYRKDNQAKIKEDNPDAKFEQVSKIVGDLWKNESNQRKNNYILLSNLCNLVHQDLFPNYKFKPKSKENSEQVTSATETDEEAEGAEGEGNAQSESHDNDSRVPFEVGCSDATQGVVDFPGSNQLFASCPVPGMPIVYDNSITLTSPEDISIIYTEENPISDNLSTLYSQLELDNFSLQPDFFVTPQPYARSEGSEADANLLYLQDYEDFQIPTFPIVDNTTNADSLLFSYNTSGSINDTTQNFQPSYDINFLNSYRDEQIMRFFPNTQDSQN